MCPSWLVVSATEVVSTVITICIASTYLYCKISPELGDLDPSFKGIVPLNIIFSYMKFDKICNLDHPVYIEIIYAGFLLHVYQNILYSVLSLTWVTPS